jgi:hypothetical protein
LRTSRAINSSFFSSSKLREVGGSVVLDVFDLFFILLVNPFLRVATAILLFCIPMPIKYCGLRYTHEFCKFVGTLVAQHE